MVPAVCHAAVVWGGVVGTAAEAPASVSVGRAWADGLGLGPVDATGDPEAVGPTDGVEGDGVSTGEGVAPAAQPLTSASDARTTASRAATVCERMFLGLRDG